MRDGFLPIAPLLQVMQIVATKNLHFCILDVPHDIGALPYQFGIMGSQKQGAAPVLQASHQGATMALIEMVAGFVQQQHVGFGGKRLAQAGIQSLAAALGVEIGNDLRHVGAGDIRSVPDIGIGAGKALLQAVQQTRLSAAIPADDGNAVAIVDRATEVIEAHLVMEGQAEPLNMNRHVNHANLLEPEKIHAGVDRARMADLMWIGFRGRAS
ncbi:hypothetical protein ABC383_11400 [Noviherbaspirillum sp. 1P10PC]